MDDKVTFANGEPLEANLASKELHSSNVSVHSPYTSDTEGKENEENPFKDPKTLAHWQKVYENASYECRHVLFQISSGRQKRREDLSGSWTG